MELNGENPELERTALNWGKYEIDAIEEGATQIRK